MSIGRVTPLHHATPLRECFSIYDVRTLVAKQLGVALEFVTSETHFTNDLGADLLDRVELMLAIEAKFAGVEITDDDLLAPLSECGKHSHPPTIGGKNLIRAVAGWEARQLVLSG